MALGFDQEILDTRRDYVNPFHVERGGILSLTTLSGIQFVTYESNPTQTTVPIGLMMHDQEEVDLYRVIPPWRAANRYPEYTQHPYLIRGTVITNAIHPDIDSACVRPGAPAYLAPSGLITCVTTYNSTRIGTFDSLLNDPSMSIPANTGVGSILRVGGNEAIVNPEPVFVSTAGWARIRINI